MQMSCFALLNFLFVLKFSSCRMETQYFFSAMKKPKIKDWELRNFPCANDLF
jgi:hypothetical protein